MRRFIFGCLLLLLALPASAQAPCCGGYNFGQSYTGLVASTWGPFGGGTVTFTTSMGRTAHYANQKITSLQLVFPNFSWNQGFGGEVGNGNGFNSFPSATVTASIEYPPGSCQQVLFSGIATGSMAGGVKFITSDSLTLTNPIPAGGQFFVREFYTGSSGILAGFVLNGLNPGMGNFLNAGGTDQTVTCTTVANNPGNATAPVGPIAIIGPTTRPSVCLIGDSLAQGNTQQADDKRWDALQLGGDINSGLLGSFAVANLAYGGSSAANWAASPNSSGTRAAVFPFCTHVYDELGINDICGSAVSAATLEGSLQTIYTNFRSLGVSPAAVVRTTLVPHTSSTDNWATSVNQTPFGAGCSGVAATNEATRETFNSDVNNTTFFTGVPADLNQTLATSAPTYKVWLSQASSAACGNARFTIDGTHPSTCANALVTHSSALNLGGIHR